MLGPWQRQFCIIFDLIHDDLAGDAPDQEIIIMYGEGSKSVEYQDTDETIAMRRDTRLYNHLLARTFIDIPDQAKPTV